VQPVLLGQLKQPGPVDFESDSEQRDSCFQAEELWVPIQLQQQVDFVRPLSVVGRAVDGCITRELNSCQSQMLLVDSLVAGFARGFELERQDSVATCTGYSLAVAGMDFAAAVDVGPVAVDVGPVAVDVGPFAVDIGVAAVEAALVEVGIGTGDSAGIAVAAFGIEVAPVVVDFVPVQRDSNSSSPQE
jgi:hypothetical protein